MKKAIKKIMAWSLAFVCAATAGISAVATNGFGLFAPEEQAAIQKPILSGGFEIKDEDVKGTAGMSLHVRKLLMSELDNGIMPTSEDAYQLTATVLPADAADKTVTYSVAWSNANSTWASGKTVTDYVSVTQTSTGSLTATATCKQAFGEPIVVTVTSNNNAAAKATATLHYKQKVAYVQLCDSDATMWDDPLDRSEYENGPDFLWSNIYVDFSYDYSDMYIFAEAVGTTVYTREEDFSGVTFTMAPTTEFAAVLTSLGIPTTLNVQNNALSWDELPTKAWFERYGTTPAKKNQIINALVAFEGVVAYTAVVEVPGLYTSETFSISFDTSMIADQKSVESVSLNNVELEF